MEKNFSEIKSIAIISFLQTYMSLEKNIKFLFQKEIQNISDSKKNILYFYYGGLIGTHINHEDDSIKLKDHPFKKNESFPELSLNQILKINKKHNILEHFPKDIPSKKSALTNLDLGDSILKLVNMRNVLAHELENISFKEQRDVIEVLQISQDDFPFLKDYDPQSFENEIQFILSNCIYAQEINKLITEKASELSEVTTETANNLQ